MEGIDGFTCCYFLHSVFDNEGRELLYLGLLSDNRGLCDYCCRTHCEGNPLQEEKQRDR